MRVLICVAVLLIEVGLAHSHEPGWGTLRGNVKCDYFKSVGPLAGFDLQKDSLCRKQLLDESLLIDEKSRGLKNVLIYLRSVPSRIHPEYEKQLAKEVVLDAKDCRFEPRISVVWIGRQRFVTRNSDVTGHNVVFEAGGLSGNRLLATNTVAIDFDFKKSTRSPFEVFCNIHPWMHAYGIVVDSPYYALTDIEGEFEIARLPAGEPLEFFIWHERYGFITPTGAQERSPFTLHLETDEVRILANVVLSKPAE